jgi:diaminopimelate epimerase
VTSELHKVEGAGNDFLLGVGPWARRFDRDPDLVRQLCDRRRGIGADGTLAVELVSDDRVRLGYRNADGSRGDFCANGTRCAARAAVELLGCNSKLVIETDWAEVSAEVTGSQVSLELPQPGRSPSPLDIALPECASSGYLMEVGVPHLVVASTGLGDIDLSTVAPPLRSHPALGPDGANVDFYEVADDGAVPLRTWERGVEGETLSCGSGMVAVALVVMADRGSNRVELAPRSGDRLVVEALGEPPACATRLTGPTRIVATIDPSDELLQDF